MNDLIAHARANPNEVSFGSSGAGRADHPAGEMFNRMARSARKRVTGGEERSSPLGLVHFPTATPEAFGAYIRSEMKK